MKDVLSALLNLILASAIALPMPGYARDPGPDVDVNPDKWTFDTVNNRHYIEVAQKTVDAFHGPQISTLHEEIQSRVEEGMKRLPTKRMRPSFMAHSAETMMQLWILAYVHAVYQQHKMQPLNDRKVSLGQAAAITADQLANGFDIYAGMMGASAASFGFKKPLGLIRNGLLAAGTKEGLTSLITSGVGGFVTFFGWEGGEQLFQQSMYDLSAEEMQVAKNLRFFDILFNKADNFQQWKTERAVLAKMLANAFCIMTFVNPHGTSEWIYNTWRLRLGTGRFITTFTSVVSAGTLAGTFAPGEGTLIAFCFSFVGGLVGGAIAMLLPDELNDAITDSIRAKRVNYGYDNLEQNLGLLKRYQIFAHRRGQVDGFKAFLKYRTTYRNDIATALFEQIYEAYVKMQEADVILGLVKAKTPVNFVRGAAFDAYVSPERVDATRDPAKPLESVSEIGAEFLHKKEEAKKRFKYYFEQLMALQRNEAIALGTFAVDESPEFPAEARMAAKSAIADQKTVLKALRQMEASLLPEMKANFEELKDWRDEDLAAERILSQILLNVYYLRGFNEVNLME